MSKPRSDSTFTDEVARFYESTLVPLIFEPYADDLARRARALDPRAVLEVACGTGVVTRALARALPDDCASSESPELLTCTWRTTARTFGHGTLAAWISADRNKKIRLHCAFPTDGAARAPESCRAEIGA